MGERVHAHADCQYAPYLQLSTKDEIQPQIEFRGEPNRVSKLDRAFIQFRCSNVHFDRSICKSRGIKLDVLSRPISLDMGFLFGTAALGPDSSQGLCKEDACLT